MKIQIVTADGKEVEGPFLLRLCGWSEERYFAEAPEDKIWEFKDGEVIVHSPATLRHQRPVLFLTMLLSFYVQERQLGEVFNGPAALHLREGSAKEPDIFFIRREHLASIGNTWVYAPADLVIEVMSPSTRSYDLLEKAQDYLEAGVLEYWVVDSQRHQVHVYVSGYPHAQTWEVRVLERGRLTSAAVPGFWIEVAWLWQEPLPGALSKLREVLAG